MKIDFQDRIFLLLSEDNDEIKLIKDILKSPLGLASDMIKYLFEERFDELKDELDEIKQFAAGIRRADKLSQGYSLASYYSYMFAFHQFFHSSYRARQGKVLEKMLQNILREYGKCDNVPDNNQDRLSILKDTFNTDEIQTLDLDAMGIDSIHEKIIIIQLRSRDDTGGTTAKGSLVDMLRELLRTNRTPKSDVLYLVCIWDPRDSQQKNSTVKKMFSSLKGLIELEESKFSDVISTTIRLKDRVFLRMVYGTDEIAKALYEWIADENKDVLRSISTIVRSVENWDDLWVSYAVASLELESLYISSKSNIRILNEKCEGIEFEFKHNSYNELTRSIDSVVPILLCKWNENSLPLCLPSDQAHYIRDLLFLKACYERINSNFSYIIREQLSLFGDIDNNVLLKSYESNSDDSLTIPVSFRELVPEISDTGYLTHSVYYYPAKFIPHVVRYCIEKFTSENEWIVDPFAGSGTVALESFLCKRNSFLLDINPLLNHIIPIKIYKSYDKLRTDTLFKLLDCMKKSSYEFTPHWSNINYWYPTEILDLLKKYWGWQRQQDNDIYSLIIEASLIKVSKHFSYAEHKTPKLFKSKSKIKYIENLLKTNWKDKLDEMILTLSYETLGNINQFIKITKDYDNQVVFHGGVDSSHYLFNHDVEFDALITSPPYLQAQEYIRTSKLDLYWLGYREEEIKRLSKLEIPYRKPDRIISTETLQKVKSSLEHTELTKLLDSYFCHTINALENSMNKLKENSMACIFIGNPKVDGIEVEIWRILNEYFIEKGYIFEGVYEDRIKNRQLFKARNNKNPDGMKSEYLLVLRKSSK